MADLSNPLTQVVVGQSQPAVTVNNLFDAASPATLYGQNDLTTTGLTWGYYGGRFRGNAVAHGTIALPASQASVYIVAAVASGVVSQSTSTTNWNDSTNYMRLYLATTGSSTITDWDDYREWLSSAAAGTAADTETIQDIVGALLVAGSGISLNYNDGDSPATLSIAASGGATPLTQENVEDIVAALITAGSNITTQYNDGDSPATFVISAAAGATALTQENVEDIVASLITVGAGLSTQYNDGDSPATLAVTSNKVFQFAASDETTALTTGTAKMTFRMPHALTVTAVRASLTTAQASGSIFTVDINEGGTTILSTKITIDNTEKTSTTAATAAVVSDASLADDAEITVDIDQVGDGTATGLKITVIGT